ncbi:Fatty acid synthase, partial [Frankliniella fusca]
MDHQEKDCVVVAGVGARYPECNNLQEFGDALMNGTDVITDSYERWKPGRLGLVGQTGKVSGIDKFDAVFFGMHRKLTDATDPLSRVLMERVFEAIVDAGINPVKLRGTRTAVFMGTALSESENIFIQTTAEDGFGIMGHNRSMMANRVSYYFDFKGPSYAFDTSFCSGLSALELGKRAIDTGECDYAIVGTATLSFHPEITQHFHDLSMVCPDGVTKPFHKDANGWVRSEGAICMLLQRKSAAKRVYASVEHVKVKKFSKDHNAPLLDIDWHHMSQSLTEFYRELEEMTGITPDDIDYLEAEGAGWKRYDELEVCALDEAICARRTRPLLMGSVMGQMGHAESSSGLMALSKVLIAMERGVIPATQHVDQDSINPALRAVVEGRLQVVTEHTPHQGALFAVNNFGLAHLFGHAVLRANPKTKAALPAPKAMEVLNIKSIDSRRDGGLLLLKPIPKMVFVSARNENRMAGALERLHALTEDDPEYARLMHEVYSMHIYGHLQRAYTFIPHGEGDAALPHEHAPAHGARRPVWFVYSGMGSQWAGMARELLRVPVFRRAVQRCHDALQPHGVNLMHIITTEDPSIFDNILHSFVGIAAVQVGLTDVLTALGIKPDGIIGHSVGELGCGYADGCFTAEQMVLAAHARGRASIETVLIHGTMAAVGLGYEEVKGMLPPTIEVACHNSKTSSTISGPAEDMQRFVTQLKDKGVFAKAVNVSNIAYHSRYIAPAGPKLLSLLQGVLPEPRPRSERWVSTSVLEERWGEPLAQTSSAEYHTNNLLSPVFFEEGSTKIPKDAIAIEIAPHGLLQAILRRSLDPGVTNVPLTRRDAPDGALFLLEAIGKLYLAGLNPQIQNLYDPVEFPVSRGTAPLSPLAEWDHTETWYTGRFSQQTKFIPGENHYPVRALDAEYAPYRDYLWQGRSIMTPAVCLEKVVSAIHEIHDEEVPVVFEDVQFYEILDMPLVVRDSAETIPSSGSQEITDRDYSGDDPEPHGATHPSLCPTEEALVYVMYQRGSGQFEVSSDLHVMARGRAYSPWDGAKGIKKLWSRQPAAQDEGLILSSQDDVYDELWRRGVSVGGKLKALRTVAASQSDVQGRVANLNSAMLQLDALLQVYTLLDSEACAELRVPHRIQRVIVDSDRTLLHEDGPPEEEEQPSQEPQPEQRDAKKAKKEIDRPLLGELVFRLHRATRTLRCANIEVVGVATRPFPAQDERHRLAVDLEKFVAHGDQPADIQSSEALVSAAVQLATQQVALQPLARQSTETVVGLLEGVSAALEQQVRGLARRSGGVLVRRLSPQEAELEAAHCDLLVQAGPGPALLLAPHALLLAELAAGQQARAPAVPEAAVLLQQEQGARRLVLYKR